MKNPKFSLSLFVLILLGFATSMAIAAPYGSDGMSIEFTQPDGSTIALRVFGDEYYGRTETLDGYTVVFDPLTNAYHYAALTPDGNEFASTGRQVGKVDPKTLGLAKGIEINPASRAAKARKNYEANEAIVKQEERWEAVKAANRNYEAFKIEVKKQEKAGKKGFVVPMGTVLPDAEIPVAPTVQFASGDGTVTGPPPIEMAPPSFTLAGNVVGLTILIDFSDVPGNVVTQAQIDDYCNKPNYTGFSNAGSIYDYFFIQSGGKLRYNNNVTYYVRVPQPKSYYNVTTTDAGVCGRSLLNDALNVLIANGYDFSKCSTKVVGGKNYIRACNVLFAGANSGVWSYGLWPHRSSITAKLVGTNTYVYDYQITEIGTTASMKIGTVCHENGHMLLGYPDLYNYDGNAAGVGNFSLMDGGNYGGSPQGTHPVHIDPYLKRASGWMDVVELNSASSQRCTVQADGNQVYRYLNPAKAQEYFLFELRDNTGYEGPYGGQTGSVNPSAGLVAYHALETGSNTYSSIFTANNPACSYTKPYELMLIEANQKTTITPWYDDTTPDTADAFKITGKSAISDITAPDLKFWDATGRNTASGADINSISADSNIMTFVAGAGALGATPSIVLSRSTLNSYCSYGVTAAAQTFSICNGQGGTLSYTITDDQSWLSCTPASGTATTGSNLITINYTTIGLAAGTYTATITVTDPAASPTTKTIAVSLTVTPQPVIAVTPTTITKSGITGTSGPQATFAINNIGGGAMNYTLSTGQSWLTLSPATGTVVGETDTIYANFNATSLAPGTYNGSITVTSAEANNSPFTIPVTFTVDSTDMILTAPNGGESWFLGTTQNIAWGSSLGGTVKIELFKAGVLNTTIATGAPNTGSYSWIIPGALTPASDYKIRVTSVESPTKTDESLTTFSIAEDLLAVALDTANLTWATSTALPWFKQSTTTKDGVDAAQCANITHSEATTMETTIVGPGTMTFWWQVSSESGYDFLRFYLNGVEQTGSLAKISGNVAWVQKTVTIPAGSNVVKWGYDKDGSVDGGTLAGVAADTAWVDQVVFTPDALPEIAVEQPVGTDLTDGASTADFGSVNTGSNTSLTFTIKNVGTADLTGITPTISGTNSTDFTVTTIPAATVIPSSSTTCIVRFTPGAAGTRTALLQIANNDANENPFDINLTGNGVGAGSLAVTPAGNFAPAGNFGGPFSATQVYTLSNPGNTSINWTAGKIQAWTTLSATSGTLAAGTNTTVTVSINAGANTLNAGSYSDTVTFTNTTNSSGNTTRGVTLTVNPAPATVTLSNLAQTYDGTSKSVTVTTNPASLANTVTYNGSATAPTNPGTYAVVATITNSNYSGSASNNLVIAKASQTITFNALSSVLDNAAPFGLTATASSALAVSYSSSNTSVATVSGSTVTIVGLGTTTITASQAGNTNYDPAPSVGQVLTVVRSNPLAVTGGPYKVIVGQSLSLNGSTSEASYGNSITLYEWDLNNDGTFTDAAGATSAAIPSATLTTTWGMSTSVSNTIKLRVTDSAAKTSIVSTTVDLINALTWDANAATAGQTNGGGAWLNASQWWDGSANLTWTPGANTSFGGTSTAGGAVTLASPTSVGSITFNTFTGTYTLGSAAQTLTINGSINKTATSAAVTFVSPIVLGGNQTWTNNSTGVLSINDALNNNGYNLTLNGTGQVNFATAASVLSGLGAVTVSSGLTKLGSGVAPLHTYSGDTNINGGVVMFANNFSPNSNININGGILESYWNSSTINALGSGANQIRLTGGESGFSLNGNTGQTINLGNAAATITWGSANFAPTKLVFQSAFAQASSAITFANGLDLNGATRTIVVNGGVAGGARATISGAISNSTGTAGLIKEGAAILTLSNNSSAWNGTTTISDGLLDLGGINLANIGGGAGRNITVTSGSGIRFNTLSNGVLNRIVETTAEITVMTGATANNLDFSSSTGANLPNAFLGCWASNGAKTEYSGTITPASDNYRLAGKRSSGLLGIVGTNKLTGAQGLLVGTTTGGGRVELAGANDFSGNTEIRSGTRLTLSNNLALQNSSLDLGSAGGTFSLSDGLNAGRITGGVAAPSPTFGGLIGSRDLLAAFSGSSGGNNESVLPATGVTGFTLNPGIGKSYNYSGTIADFAVGTTITKSGAGIQILSGANTYTGATTVSAGKLLINGSLSNVAAALNVASGATLGGKGTIGRNVSIADGGQLEFDISTAAASHDRLDISAGRDFTFSGTSVLTITTAGGASAGTYTLLTGGNNLIGVAPVTLNLPVGWTATVSISGNSLLLNVTSTTGGAGSLAVTGAAGLSSSGYAGGSFAPNSIIYTLTNPGQAPINWTAGKTAAWLDLSVPSSGTLAAGANTTVTVTINATANSLAAGSYSDTVTFSNTTNATGDTTRSVALTVNPLGTYIVSYNGNGNTSGAAPSNQTKTQGVNLTLLGQGALARTGYTFSNWYTTANGSGGTPYAAGASYTVDAALNLYAQWTANIYSVAFDANGGDVPSFTNKSVTYGAAYGSLATVARTGYTFNGWFTAASGGTLVTAVSSVATAGNHTLYAQWTASTATVTFNSNGGDAPSPTSMLVTYDSAYGILAAVTRTGYTFNGWFTAASGGALVTAGTLVTTTSSHTLYAQWTIKTYTVTYTANGAGSGTAPSNQTKTHDVDLTLSNSGSLAKVGYSFSGWNTAADGSGTNYSAGANYTGNADLTLYAKWTVNTYTVTFNPNGGLTSVPTSKSVTFDSVYGTLATTTRTGYRFNGWFTSASGGSLVAIDTTVTNAANHTLYAQWTPIFSEMDVIRDTTAIVLGSYDFITGSIAGADTKLTYSITNSGSDDLTLASAVITSANCTVVVDSQPATSVAPLGNTSLILTAVPSASGAWSYTVSIQNNDPDENPYQWTVHGVAASSSTVSLVAVEDTYIANGATTTNYGIATTFSVFNRTQASNLYYGLLRFDLSGIPTNATVTTASLDLFQNNTQAGPVNIYASTGVWTETAATWANSNLLFGTTSFGTASAPGTAGGSVSIGLNTDGLNKVQSWLTTPAGNYGFGVKTTNSNNNTNIDLRSREHATTANRPKLTLNYTINPQVAEMDVTRAGSAVADEGTDAISGSIVGSGTQLTYTIANLGNVNLTLTTPTTPVLVSGNSNCTVVVNSQPTNTVLPSTGADLLVTVTPGAIGNWTATLSIANNDPNEAPYNWTISGTAMSRYNSWASGTAMNVDSNGDGISNGVAWVLGATNLSSNATVLLPILDNSTDPNYVIFTYRRRDDANTATNTTIAVEYSSNLTAWTSAADATVNVNNNGNIEITETNDGYGAGVDKVEVKIKRTLAVGNKIFSRLSVNITP